MAGQQTWLARLTEAFVEQGVFSLKPLPKTRAEAELDAGTPGRATRRTEVSPGGTLGLDDGRGPGKRPDSL